MEEKGGLVHARADTENGKQTWVLMQAPERPLPGLLQLLERHYTVLQMQAGADAYEELEADWRRRVSALVACGAVDRQLLDALPNLRIVCNTRIGMDNIDVDLCRQRGIHVTNGAHPSVVSDTADMALLLMLAARRRFCPAHTNVVQSGSSSCSFPSCPLATKASGLRVGIVGLGQIGKAIAKRALGLNNIVAYFGRTKQQDAPYAYYNNLMDLAANSDILICACPLTRDTKHLVGKDVFNALGPKGTLINIARGLVVDEQELCKALVEKRLGAAGLDVFENEPFVPVELIGMDNVVLTPHIGASTWENRAIVAQLIADNLKAFFSGNMLLTSVL